MKLIIFFVLCCFTVDYSTALNETALLDKIETLDLPELLNASLFDAGHEKANILYKWKYGDYLVKIGHINHHIYTSNDVVFVDAGSAVNFLKAFGKSIERLSVVYHLLPHNHKEIGKYINEFCSETLVEFNAKNSRPGSFDNMTKPFTKVERVTFEGQWETVENGTLGLDELFPEMRVLNLSYSYGYVLERVFPKLVELNADVTPSTDFFKFLELNPSLRQLRLETTSMELLQNVNDKLPKLEVFDFHVPKDMPSYQGKPIEFKQVKETSIKDTDRNIRSGHILFKQLKKLQLAFFGDFIDVWTEFIGLNANLDTLKITYGNLNNATLLTLASKLNKLVVVDVRCETGTPTESIVKFVESNPKLQTLTLRFPENSVFLFETLSVELGKKWDVTPVNQYLNAVNIKPSSHPSNAAANTFSCAILIATMSALIVKFTL